MAELIGLTLAGAFVALIAGILAGRAIARHVCKRARSSYLSSRDLNDDLKGAAHV